MSPPWTRRAGIYQTVRSRSSRRGNPIDKITYLLCPLLALFGIEDQNPVPEQAERLRAEPERHVKTCEWVMYDNAGHAFFADYLPSYRAAPAHDMWHRVLGLYGKPLA